MNYHDIQQNSPEWFALRIGKFTASTFKDLFAKPGSVTYEKAINKVVYELITAQSPESFSNEWMVRGSELEPLARKAYEDEKMVVVKNGGFFVMNEYVGASPDGLVGIDGLIEIKCPAYHTHIDYLLKKKVPADYYCQMQGQMFVTGRQWCDFVSYHPNLPILILRVERDEEFIKELSDKIAESWAEVQKRLKQIT
jgi:putative phage-type endonuclease